jgi:hypothetical protein
MCKWQMDDPEARVKSSLSDCTWFEDLSMDLSSRHLRTYEAKRSEEHLYYFFTFILFPSHFSLFLSFFIFFLYSSFFPYFSFLLIIIIFSSFIFYSFFLLLLKTFYNKYLHRICVREWLLPHAWTMLVLEHKREGKWLLK